MEVEIDGKQHDERLCSVGLADGGKAGEIISGEFSADFLEVLNRFGCEHSLSTLCADSRFNLDADEVRGTSDEVLHAADFRRSVTPGTLICQDLHDFFFVTRKSIQRSGSGRQHVTKIVALLLAASSAPGKRVSVAYSLRFQGK